MHDNVRSTVFYLDVSEQLPEGDEHRIAVEIFWQQQVENSTPAFERVLFCKPGGAMNRHYFNLTAEGEYTHSFAHYMAKRGIIVVTIDHLGVGESSVPDDGYQLTLEVLTAANHAAVKQVIAGLKSGELGDGLPVVENVRAIGVGHSMGAMLSVVQQHRHHSYEALVLLGFCNRGMPDILSDEQKQYIDESAAARRDAIPLAQQYFPQPYVHHTRERGAVSGKPNKSTVSAIAKQAVLKTEAPLLAVGGIMSLIPGSIAPEMGNIEVPVFLGIGDRDLVEHPRSVPAEFSRCGDISLMVLEQTGHNHFLYDSCTRLFERVYRWVLTH